MSNFDPPAPTTIRTRPITIGAVVDLQHEDSGSNGFISGPQCWYRVGGELNREIVVPTLSNSPIGHEILSVSGSLNKGDKLISGSSIFIRSVWQSPVWPSYKVWQYLGAWGGDNNASYYHIDDKWQKNSKWIIEKVLKNGSISGPGEVINSGDRVRFKAENHKKWLANSIDKHVGEHHSKAIEENTDEKRITWVIWVEGAAS